MKNQPFIYFTIVLACGVYLAKVNYLTWHYILAAILLLFILTLLVKKNFIINSILVGFIFLGIGALRYESKTHYTHLETRNYNNKTFYPLTILKNLKKSKNHTKYLTKNKDNKVLLYVKDMERVYFSGDEVWVYGNLTEVPKPKNPHQFNYKEYLSNHNIYYQVFTDSISKVEAHGNSWRNKVEKAKFNIKNILENQGYSKGSIAMLSAMLLGDKSDIDANLYENFRKVGVVHLLAISGLHVAMIFSVFYMLFSFLSGSYGKKIKIILSLIFIWLFAFFVNFSPSVTRACTMLSLYFIAQLLNRSSNAIHTLALSAFILLLINPLFLFDVGFQLSYSAVFFIGWFFPFFKKSLPSRYKVIRYFRDILGSSIAAQLGTAPFVIYYFNTFSWLFLFGNLVLIPLAFLMLTIGMPIILLAYFNIRIALLVKFYNYFIGFVHSYIGFWAKWDGWITHNIYLSSFGLIIFLLCLFLLGVILKKFNKKILFMLLILGLIFQIERALDVYKKSNKKEFIVFNQYKNTVIGIRDGNTLDVFISNTLEKEAVNRYIVNPFIIYERIDSVAFYDLNTSIEKEYKKTNDIFLWNNKKILLFKNSYITDTFFDIVLLESNSVIDCSKKNPPTTTWVTDGSFYSFAKQNLDSLSKICTANFYNTKKSGAFILKN